MKRIIKLNDKRNTNKGITLIALVITIIVLLILAAVSIATLTGDNGILTKAQTAKEETRAASVLEEANLWKANLEADNYTENKTSQTLEELVNDLVTKNLLTEDEKDTIIGNAEKEGTGEITIGNQTIVFEVPITSLDQMKLQCKIDASYNIQDIANNKQNSLVKVLENDRAIKYILEHHITDLVKSETAMTLLGKNQTVLKKVLHSDELAREIVDSDYRKNFNEYIVYHKDTPLGTAGGRTYYKAYDGVALAGALNSPQTVFLLLSINENSSLRLLYL